jgi:hypothetical protein
MTGRWLATYFGVIAMMLAYDTRTSSDSFSWDSFFLCIVAGLLFMWAHRPYKSH